MVLQILASSGMRPLAQIPIDIQSNYVFIEAIVSITDSQVV
jgi:hypothetical protein